MQTNKYTESEEMQKKKTKTNKKKLHFMYIGKCNE